MNRFPFLLMMAVLAALAPLSAQQLSPYGKMRMQFAARDDFDPYKLQIIEHELMEKATQLWEERKAGEAVEVLKGLVELYPYSLGAHRRLAEGYESLMEHEKDKALLEKYTVIHRKHNEAYTGLMDSIMAGRDGKSPGSAFPVITLAEEFWVLLKLGAKPNERNVDKEAKLDIYSVVDQQGEAYQIYFDISRVLDAKSAESEKAAPAP